MKVWLLTLLILAILGLAIDLAQNWPIPMDERPYRWRATFVLVVALVLSAPTVIAVALVGR